MNSVEEISQLRQLVNELDEQNTDDAHMVALCVIADMEECLRKLRAWHEGGGRPL